MKRSAAIFLGFILLLAACSPDKTTIGIARHPVILFTATGLNWKADRYSFAAPTQVVAYPSDSTLPATFYNRLTLQAFGKSDQGNDLQLILMFDAADATQLLGTYSTLYTPTRGLAQAQVFNLNSNNLAAYSLKPNDTTAVLQIQRQSESERLIAGRFQMTLYNTRDTTERINITQGSFTDITY